MQEKYCKALEGITYAEWIKLKNAIDRSFQNKISEKANLIQLTDSDEVKNLIQSQFG